MRIQTLLAGACLVAATTVATTANAEDVDNWVAWTGTVPADAVLGGYETGRDLPVCRAEHAGGKHPGKIVAGQCNYGYGGEEHEATAFEVLTGPGGNWTAWTGSVPAGAVMGGYENGGDLPLCRADYAEGKHPGKVHLEQCHFGYAGKEVLADDFEVLVRPVAMGRWVAWTGSAPANAVVGGMENGGNLVVCRAQHENGMHPGKIHKSQCHYGFGGKEHFTDTFEVLTNPGGTENWIAHDGTVPAGAVGGVIFAGTPNEDNQLVCKASHMGGVHPGKVHGSNCHIGYGGKEVPVSDFTVLTVTG